MLRNNHVYCQSPIPTPNSHNSNSKMANPNRIAKEVEDVRRDSHAGITVTRDEADPNHITGTLRGPEGTPYEVQIQRG